MIEIIPAILPTNIGELRGKVSLVKDFVHTVQFDMCDGVFVPTRTWPYNGKDIMAHQAILNEDEGLPYWDEVNYEFDLMVKNAKDHFADIVKLGPSRLVFHLEAEKDLLDFFVNLDPYYNETIEIGIALNTTTSITTVEAYIPYIKFVQCMGIENIGHQGQPFDERVLEQIRSVRKLAPHLPVSVDGSVNHATAHILIEAGATRLVVGSALFNQLDMETTINNLAHIIV